MEDTYSLMRIFAGSWGGVFLFGAFILVLIYTLRPGSGAVHRDIASIPFRNDDKPAAARPREGAAGTTESQEVRP